MIASVGLKRRSSLLCRWINSIHQGRGYQHVPLCPTTAEICTDECCAYTCVLNHQMPFPARTHISNSQPSLCKLLKALSLQNASHPITTKDVHSPWALLEETTTVQDTTALLLAAPPPDINKTSSTGIPPELPHPSDLLQLRNMGEVSFPWEPSSRSMGLRAASTHDLSSPS